MSAEIINLKVGYPTAEEARRRIVTELELARRNGVRVLKFIHGYGSSGKGGKLRSAVRRGLEGLRVAGKVGKVVSGEMWSIFDADTRALLDRYPTLRRDPDLEQANPGITLVEVRPSVPL